MSNILQTPPQQPSPKMYIGFLLSSREFYNAIHIRLEQYLNIVDIGKTVKQNVHNYFYSEMLPMTDPIDCYLGALVVYKVNQEVIPANVRSDILSIMADMQWVLHDYISINIQTIMGRDVTRETEYYYNLDQRGRLMVYVPISEMAKTLLGVSPVPEAAVVYSCYAFLPMAKKLVFSQAILQIDTPVPF